MNRLSNTASWLMAATVLLVTVAWTNLTGMGIGANPLTYDDVALLRFAIALVGGVAVWLLLSITLARGATLAWDSTWAVLGGLGAWAVVSAAMANTSLAWFGQSERLEGAVTVVLYAVLFGAGLQLGRSAKAVVRVSGALVLGSTVLALFGLLQVAKLDHTNYAVSGYSFYMGSAFASLGNPNFLAGVLVLALPVAVGLAITANSSALRIAWWVSGAAILLALFFTYSQGAWLAAAIEIALGVGLWLWSRQKVTDDEADGKQRALRPALVALAVLGVIVVVIIAVTAVATSRGLRLWGSNLSETSSSRILLVQTAAGAIAERPVFGYGPDNFLSAFRVHRPDRYVAVFGATSTVNNAHSWLLQYAATLGIPGALLLGAALILGLVRGRPRSRLSREEPAWLLEAAIWVAIIGGISQMMLNAAVIASTVPMWVLLGMIATPHARKVMLPRAAALGTVAACSLLLVAALVVSTALLAADAAFMSSRLAFNGDAAGDPVALAEKAASLNPLSVKYSRAVAQSRAALVLAAIDQSGTPDAQVRALYDGAKAAYDSTLKLSPTDYAALSWLAGLQAAVGTRLDDPALLAAAKDTASRAAAVDLTHWTVALLLKGDTSRAATRQANLAPGLP